MPPYEFSKFFKGKWPPREDHNEGHEKYLVMKRSGDRIIDEPRRTSNIMIFKVHICEFR